MNAERSPSAWLLLAAGDDRGHGGNEGYDDQFDAYYSWDSNVPNHRKVQVGDPVALWDKNSLLGASVVEEITVQTGTKLLFRCPACTTTRISERSRILPRFRCMRCRHEFSTPASDTAIVDLYRARYDAAWTSLEGMLTGPEIRALAVHPGDINAMRPLDWARFREALLARGATRALDRIAVRADFRWPSSTQILTMPGGHGQSLVRVRRGQSQFRQHLLDVQGNVCAFTGPAPARALEAGHLYRYAEIGSHHEHGGLMLRRDIHTLFDDGILAVDPDRGRIDVAPALAAYPQYARLEGKPLCLELQGRQMTWLVEHWNEHRVGV